MSTSPPPDRKMPPKPFVKDRRVASDASTSTRTLRELKGMLVRPMALERRGNQLHVVLVERRRKPRDARPPSLDSVRTELRERVLAHEFGQASAVMRQLVFVHDELGRKGWPGIEVLPAKVLGRALVQAEMLAGEEPSPAMALLIERLRVLRVAADLRAERAQRMKDEAEHERIEVSEVTQAEFEAEERGWADREPPAPVPGEPDR